MRSNPMPYPAIVALALSLLLAPTLPAAAGSADRLACHLHYLFVAPYWSNASQFHGIEDWRDIPGSYTHDSTGADRFYLDRVTDEFSRLDTPGSGTAKLLIRRFPINNEDNISYRYLDTTGVNHAHSLTENSGGFLNPIDRPGASAICGLGVNDTRNMAGAYVNSTNNLGPEHSPSDPGGELTTFHPPGSIDTVDLSDFEGIVGSCLSAGSSLINDNISHLNISHLDGDSTIVNLNPRGNDPVEAGSIQNPGGDRRHEVVIRCFKW
jgi:hypothetical protein